MLTSASTPLDLNTFQPPLGSVARDAAQATSFAALASYPDDREYADDLTSRPRVQTGGAMDLGALEGH